jgi:type II secretory pathway pseudopilin PulG
MLRRALKSPAFTLIELMVVLIILTAIIALLLPALSRARHSAIAAKLAADERDTRLAAQAQAFTPARPAAAFRDTTAGEAPPAPVPAVPTLPHAVVTAFSGNVDLTPRLSVGTAQPESIYEAKFTAKLKAHAPGSAAENSKPGPCELHLPLPPQIISLADLSLTVNNAPSQDLTLRGSSLVWTGQLPATPTPLEVTYTAVGKGLYALQPPPGKILDTFDLRLTANGSDVRMLELSLQPQSLNRTANQTVYTWNYPRLMFGRPIQLDVLGIAPIDRLGELRWLGPLSVVAFGILVGLYAHAFNLTRFDRWMLILVLGAFAGAYPLMYFAQQFVRLPLAVSLSAGLVFGVIAIRSWAVIGLWHTTRGVLAPAAATMAVALAAATQPQFQGLLLTASAILFFLIAMSLLPRIQLHGENPTVSPRPA